MYIFSKPGKIHISTETKALLPEDLYRTEARGDVWVKVRIVNVQLYDVVKILLEFLITIAYWGRIISHKFNLKIERTTEN